MHKLLVAAIGVALSAPASAQNLGDVGRLLQEQIRPRQEPDQRQQEHDRAIYDQGRRDAEDRRQDELRRQDEFRRHEAERRGDRRQFEDRRRDERRDNGRRPGDPDRD